MRDHHPPPTLQLALLSALQTLAGGVALFLLAGLRGEFAGFELTRLTGKPLWAIAYLIVFGSALAFTVYMFLLHRAGFDLCLCQSRCCGHPRPRHSQRADHRRADRGRGVGDSGADRHPTRQIAKATLTGHSLFNTPSQPGRLIQHGVSKSTEIHGEKSGSHAPLKSPCFLVFSPRLSVK